MATNYAASYDLETLVGQVRLEIQDTDTETSPPAPPPDSSRDDWSCLFTDQEIGVYLSRYFGPRQVPLAAADLLMTIASQQVLLERRIKLGGYEQDTKFLARSIAQQANALRHALDGVDIGVPDGTASADSVQDFAWTDANAGRIFLGEHWPYDGVYWG